MLPVLLAATLTAMLGPAPDPKPSYGPAPRPTTGSELTLGYLAAGGTAMAVTLTCDPPGGGHPRAAAACATLERAGADPDRITRSSTACILLYKPVTATMSGTWQGREVSWTHRFGNSCEMRRATGALFRF